MTTRVRSGYDLNFLLGRPQAMDKRLRFHIEPQMEKNGGAAVQPGVGSSTLCYSKSAS